MREIREKWERKTLNKRWIIRHYCGVTWLIFETLCPVAYLSGLSNPQFLEKGLVFSVAVVVVSNADS